MRPKRPSFSLPCISLACALLLTAAGGVHAQDISLVSAYAGQPPALDSERAADVVLHALTLAGVRYSYGGTSTVTGMDCSALVQHVFRHAWRRELPRTSEEQSEAGDLVLPAELEPGDLVFFNTLGRRFSHVGIYVGEHRFVHAPRPGGRVRVESMDKAYWKTRYNGARRIADPSPPASPSSTQLAAG